MFASVQRNLQLAFIFWSYSVWKLNLELLTFYMDTAKMHPVNHQA